MTAEDVNWPLRQPQSDREDRIAYMRPIHYEVLGNAQRKTKLKSSGPSETGKALSVNVSSRGILLLMERTPQVKEHIRIEELSSDSKKTTATIGEVRWARPLPFNPKGKLHFVGIKFLHQA